MVRELHGNTVVRELKKLNERFIFLTLNISLLEYGESRFKYWGAYSGNKPEC